MHIALDYTTGIYPGAGVARYTRSLVAALARLDADNRYSLFYANRGLPRGTPEEQQARALMKAHPNFRGVAVPLSVRQMFAVWQRLRLPIPVDLFTGRCDLLHSPDFVSPPHRTGADIITVHDLSFLVVPECAEPGLAGFLSKTVPGAVRRADGIIAVSEQTKRDLVRLMGVAPEKVTVVHNGVDERFRAAGRGEIVDEQAQSARLRQELGLPERFVLHVGTLEPRKNLVRLIEGYAQAVSAMTGDEKVALVLAGRKGWLYEPILAAGTRVNSESASTGARVVFVDYVDERDLPLLYRMAEVFAYPSLYEGFGLPVAEAMSCGTPVLVSEDDALAEVVGEAALVVDARSVESIAGGISRLLGDADLRRALSDAGRARAARFTWETAAEQVLQVYERFVGRKTSRRS
ncbi:MAG TPA: glycosyltransferase family 1 protein [Chloroflexia bacterium]|nr:glycosyltransferase family 1 protein [Chloroflexia bacterium]